MSRKRDGFGDVPRDVLFPNGLTHVDWVSAASPGGITSKSIAAAASKRKKAKRKPVFKSRRFLVPGAVVVITFNRKSNGSLLDVTGYLQAAVEKELAEQQQETKAA